MRTSGVAGGQRHELIAPAGEEPVGADDKRAGVQLDKRGESGVDPAFRAGLQDIELHPCRALQRFACARLSRPCLPKSCLGVSATLTTTALARSSLRWLEIGS